MLQKDLTTILDLCIVSLLFFFGCASQSTTVHKANSYEKAPADMVFLVRESEGMEVAMAHGVELGAAQDNEVVVLEGVSPGDRLIVVGQQSVAWELWEQLGRRVQRRQADVCRELDLRTIDSEGAGDP